MRAHTLLPTLAALTLAAAPLAAQHAAASRDPRPAPRALAVYRLAAPQRLGLPTEVTVADSAGVVVASYRIDGRTVRPMVVGMIDSGMVLQGETPEGVLTLVLYADDAAPGTGARRVVGQWTLGDRQGRLHARTRA